MVYHAGQKILRVGNRLYVYIKGIKNAQNVMGRLTACPSEVDYYHFVSTAKLIKISQKQTKKAEKKFNPSYNI